MFESQRFNDINTFISMIIKLSEKCKNSDSGVGRWTKIYLLLSRTFAGPLIIPWTGQPWHQSSNVYVSLKALCFLPIYSCLLFQVNSSAHNHTSFREYGKVSSQTLSYFETLIYNIRFWILTGNRLFCCINTCIMRAGIIIKSHVE